MNTVFENSVWIGKTIDSVQKFYKSKNRFPKDYNELLAFDPQSLDALKSAEGIIHYEKSNNKAIVNYSDNRDRFQQNTTYEVVVGKPPATASFLELSGNPIPWNIDYFVSDKTSAIELESLRIQQSEVLAGMDIES